MKSNRKRFSHRVITLFAIVLMLAITLASLTSCGGSSYSEMTESEKDSPKFFVAKIIATNET